MKAVGPGTYNLSEAIQMQPNKKNTSLDKYDPKNPFNNNPVTD